MAEGAAEVQYSFSAPSTPAGELNLMHCIAYCAY